jgi:acetyl esterase/lipase
MPFVLRPRQVEALRNLSYGDAGRYNQLDLYRHRSTPAGAPVLVYFHGGGFYGGRKSFEGRALLFRLASQGWVTISANYRLRPDASFFDHLTDVKKVIAWVRQNGQLYGADPSTLFLAGGSAGGHLSSIAALTQNNPRYQPGFEDVDTSITAVASLYGWYGGYYEMGGPETEVGVLGHDAGQAPPFFIAHGEDDTLAHVETARRFVAHLRSASPNPVVYAELPHGQHAFDLFHSFRFSAVVDGIEAFAARVRSTDR